MALVGVVPDTQRRKLAQTGDGLLGRLRVVRIRRLTGLVSRDALGDDARGRKRHALADDADDMLRVGRESHGFADLEPLVAGGSANDRVVHVEAVEIRRQRRPRLRRPLAVLHLGHALHGLDLPRRHRGVVELALLELEPLGRGLGDDRAMYLVQIRRVLLVPVVGVLHQIDVAVVLPLLDHERPCADRLAVVRLGADLLDVVDRRDRSDRVAESLRELGERVAQGDLERGVVDRPDSREALLALPIAAVGAALDRGKDVGRVRSVGGVGRPVPRIDEVLSHDLATHRGLEHDALLEMEGPDGRVVVGLPALGDLRLGHHAAALVLDVRDEPLECIVGDLPALALLHADSVDRRRVR